MLKDPVLFVGGSGNVARCAARMLREAHPDLPILVGGRTQSKVDAVAAELGRAEGVVLDLAADDLGLGTQGVSAVAIFFTDEHVSGLRFAQSRGIPFLGISTGIQEMGPEVALFMKQPQASAVVLGAEWLVGAATFLALQAAREFSRVDEVVLCALLDDQDTGGPAAAADMERVTQLMPNALIRRDGAFVWLSGEETRTSFRAVDGTEVAAAAFSPFDVVSLATALNAPHVRMSLGVGVTSSRRRGEAMSTEVLVELGGLDASGAELRTRHALVHPQGENPLTAQGVALLLERLLGLDGGAVVAPGLYFPSQLLEPAVYLERQKAQGVVVTRLEVAGGEVASPTLVEAAGI